MGPILREERRVPGSIRGHRAVTVVSSRAPGRPAALAMGEREKGLCVCVCGVPDCSNNRVFNEVWSDGQAVCQIVVPLIFLKKI